MATIGRTFIDPDKYEQNWFLSLPMEMKYLYMYCWERCDHAGVLEVSIPMWSFHTKLEVDKQLINKMIELCNEGKERVVKLGSKIWFTEYIRFNQQTDPTKGLSANYPFHKHVFGRLKTHNLVEEVNKRDPILLRQFNHLINEEIDTSKPYPSLTQDLTKQIGKEAGRGGGNGTGRGGGQGLDDSSYYQSLEIVERLFVDENVEEHEIVKRVNELTHTLKEKGKIEPFNFINQVLLDMEGYYPKSELTIEALEEKLGHKN